MTDDRRFERSAREWLEAGPDRAPDRVVEAAFLEIDSTSQERDLRVPWRLNAMYTPMRIAAAALVVGVVGVGALFLFRSSPAGVGAPTPGPQASAVVGPSATVSPSQEVTIASYRAARDAICRTATNSDIPNIDLTDPTRLYDPEMSGADRVLAAAALREVASRADTRANELQPLAAPDDILAAHLENVTRMRDTATLIRHAADLVEAGKLAEARTVDEAIAPLSGQFEAFENQYGLAHCP